MIDSATIAGFVHAFDLDRDLGDLLDDVRLDFLDADQLGTAADALADVAPD